ncbi:MAG TPA: hypothetical protein VLW83_02690, partial [Candidatus Acidoferrales bacterium]|nr:hypothetical protein [Candidatus Acidoferrales bacterium]
SPASGGRALALVDKSTGFDLLSSVGALRDGFSFTPNPAEISPERARGRYGLFNRAYEASWLPDDKNTALSLRYHAADVFPHGADIEKKIELDGDDVSVNYRVALSAANEGAAADGAAASEAQPQSWVATESVPALDEPGRLTEFCWSAVAPKDAAAAPKKESAPQPNETPAPASARATETEQCEDFAPGGAAREIPADANHLEVRTAGRPGLAFDWDSGRLTIEPKRYSALLELHSAILKPGEETRATLRFHVLAPD